jgi:O-antigen/teichoic acid export membrane protein
MPVHEIVDPMVAVALPVMARIQADHTKQREFYLTVLYWTAIISVSTSVGVALVGSDMAPLILGPQWRDVNVLMPWFALTAGLLCVSSSVYSAFVTIGKPIIAARLQWTRVGLLTVSIIPTGYFFHDLEAVAIARFLVQLVITPTLFFALGKGLNIPIRDIALTIWRPLAAGLCMAIAVLAVNFTRISPGTERLVVDVVIGATAYICALMVFWVLIGKPEGPESNLLRRIIAPGFAWGWKTLLKKNFKAVR